MIEGIAASIIASIIVGFAVFIFNRMKNNVNAPSIIMPKTSIDLSNINPIKHFQEIRRSKERRSYNQLKESTVFFSDRFAEAFPGCRDTMEIDIPSKALERLDVLLKKPLFAVCENRGANPIWWWRGHSNLHIKSYRRIRKMFSKSGEFLINEIQHYTIKRIIAVSHPSYFRKFVYIEVEGMKPTGLYSQPIKYEEYGEYGLLKKKYVTREEYDDGATVIKGKPVDIRKKVKLRSRVLRSHNFLIAPNGSPINNPQADSIIKDRLDAILRGDENIDSLKVFIFSLPRREPVY